LFNRFDQLNLRGDRLVNFDYSEKVKALLSKLEEQARQLTLKAADAMDKVGNKQAADLIAAIKIVAPRMAQTVADRAPQAHGGMGVCDDTPMPRRSSSTGICASPTGRTKCTWLSSGA
jgi:alkylation response protein AidB-like acyl-CoA dehydrogenase